MVWDRYVTPYSYRMWLAVAIAACALRVCLAHTRYGHERSQNLAVSAILFYIHACFCQQFQTDLSRHLIFFIFSFLQSMIIFYTKNFTQLNKIVTHMYTTSVYRRYIFILKEK